MRSLETIEQELLDAKKALSKTKGTNTEVYSRIVGYYRSVRNWNRGKREEYGERLSYEVSLPEISVKQKLSRGTESKSAEKAQKEHPKSSSTVEKLMLFVRSTCPACPPAKDAAIRLGIQVDLINTDTEEGLAEATKHNVMKTPTAILLAGDGAELGRALDSVSIAAFEKIVV
jgi:ribonucleoside-triphosphate reductase